ncbi:hypothetical protein [Streptomyces aureus]
MVVRPFALSSRRIGQRVTLLFLTEDGSALVAGAGWPLPLVARKPPLQERG